METGLLTDAVVFLAAAVFLVPLFTRAGAGAILGYVAAGVLIGPSVFGLISDADAVLRFSQVGVVLLLFVIGLELKPARLRVMRRPVFGLGTLQVLFTSIALALAAWAFGIDPVAAIVVGFSLSLSSTPLVLQLLGERRELQSVHGRHSFALLLFQDLAAIPALAILPLLAAGALLTDDPLAMISGTAVALAAVAGLVIGGRYLLRPALRLAASARSREIFVAAGLLVVIASALLMDLAGLSMALGAFLAGVLLADSEYRHAVEADIEPFKGLLLGLFFIAVGMTANLGLLWSEPLAIVALALGLVVVKAVTIALMARLYGLPGRDSIDTGLVLAQGGEFGFVLLTAAVGEHILPAPLVERLILVISLSMAATPLIFAAATRWLRPRLVVERPPRAFDVPEGGAPLVIIVGFGRVGQIVARILQGLGIRYTVLDANPDRVDFVRRYGNEVYYGDASRFDLLQAAGAEKARVAVLTIGDVETSVNVARLLREHFPDLAVYARARDRNHSHRLMDAGVKALIRETLFSSIELAGLVLQALGLGPAEARRVLTTFREHDEQVLMRQHAVFEDEQKLIRTVQDAALELEALYRSDERLAAVRDGAGERMLADGRDAK